MKILTKPARYLMVISAEKTKLMTNSDNGIQREIKAKGQKLGTVASFKYLGAIISDEGINPEVLKSHCSSGQLKPIWGDNNISPASKLKMMRSLLYGTPEGTFLFQYFSEKKSKQKELERKSKQ